MIIEWVLLWEIYIHRAEQPISVIEFGCFAVLYIRQKEASYLKSCQQLSLYCRCTQYSMVFIKKKKKIHLAVLLKQIFTIDKKKKKRTKGWMLWKYCWKFMLGFNEKDRQKESKLKEAWGLQSGLSCICMCVYGWLSTMFPQLSMCICFPAPEWLSLLTPAVWGNGLQQLSVCLLAL